MVLDKIVVALTGLTGIIFVYWFFLMKKDQKVIVSDELDILVEGGYRPSTVVLQKGKSTKLHFLRKDSSSCLEEVVLSDFKIRKYLPLNTKTTIEITPQKTGEFGFSCGMNMFHGKIIVR